MTSEQVLEIFRYHLAQDTEIESIKTSLGYLRIVWAGRLPFCDDASVCETPEDIRQAKDECWPYIEKRRELENISTTPD